MNENHNPAPLPVPTLTEKELDHLVQHIHRPLDDESDECWWWERKDGTPLRRRPYMTVGGRKLLVYRLVFENFFYDPGAMTVDHLCGRGGVGCIRPSHLRLLTVAENATTGRNRAGILGRQTQCSRGHDLTDPDVLYVRKDGRRMCRACIRLRQRAYRQGQYLRRLTPTDKDLSRLRYGSCAAGHDLTDPSNVRTDVRTDGTEHKSCRACARDRAAKAAARRIEGW